MSSGWGGPGGIFLVAPRASCWPVFLTLEDPGDYGYTIAAPPSPFHGMVPLLAWNHGSSPADVDCAGDSTKWQKHVASLSLYCTRIMTGVGLGNTIICSCVIKLLGTGSCGNPNYPTQSVSAKQAPWITGAVPGGTDLSSLQL